MDELQVLRTRVGEMAAEIERLSHERQCLAEAIGRIAVASGDTRTEFTGPDLLMVCGDAAEGIKHLTAENARLQSVIDEANAQEPDGFLSVVPLDGLHKNSTILARPLSPVLDGQRFYFRPIPAQQSPAVAVPRGWEIESSTSDGRTWLYLKTPDGHSAAISCKTDNDSGETLASQIVKKFANDCGSKSPRITEQDAREIIENFCNWTKIKSPHAAAINWLNELGGRALLDELNNKNNIPN